MNIPGSLADSNDNRYKQYISANQGDKVAVNFLENKNLEFDNFVLDYRSMTACYIVLKVLNRYFG